MAEKDESPPGEGRARGDCVDFQPTPHEIAQKPSIPQARRSLRAGPTPDEIGQACRAGYLSDRLAEIVLDAAVASHLLDVGADEEAIVLLTRIVGNFRETAGMARLFRDVHATQQAASDAAARAHAGALHKADRAAVAAEREDA